MSAPALPAGAVPIGAPPPPPKGAIRVAPPPPKGAVPVSEGSPQPASSGISPLNEQVLESDANRYGVPVPVVRGVQAIEEGAGDPNAVSSAGAVGLMQTMPDTFRHYEPHAALTDPLAQMDAGTQYLRDLWQEYGGNVTDVLANYNGGPGAVDYLRKHGTLKGYGVTKDQPLGETYEYVRKGQATIARYQAEADAHAANVLAATTKRNQQRALAQGQAAGTKLASPQLAGMGAPALEPFIHTLANAAAPLQAPVSRFVSDYTAAGFGRAAGIEGVTGLVPLQSETVRALAKVNPQLASDLAHQSGINPATLGLSLPSPRADKTPLTQVEDFIGAVTALPREKTFSAAMFLGNVADAAWWVPLNAAMRDAATATAEGKDINTGPGAMVPSPIGPVIGPQTQRVHDLIWKAMKNPAQAGAILDNLNHDYGFMRHADLQWWSGNPELRQYIANAKPDTPAGVFAQHAIALHAGLADAYLKAPLTTGIIAFGGEFWNPYLIMATPEKAVEAFQIVSRGLNSVGKMALSTKAAKAATQLGGKLGTGFVTSAERGTLGAGKAQASLSRLPSMVEAAKRGLQKASVFMREQAPLTSTPYSATLGDNYGFRGTWWGQNSEHELGSLPQTTRDRLNHPAYFGGTSQAVANKMSDQHDLFFNAQRTLYVKSPGGVAPTYDPVTSKMGLHLGVIPDLQQAGEYAYATFNPWQEGTQTFETQARNAYESSVLVHTLGSGEASQVKNLLDGGKIEEAFSKAGVKSEFADFEAQAQRAFQSNPPKDAAAGAAITRTMAGERIASALAKKEGWKRVWVKSPGGDQIHFVDPTAAPDQWLKPDMTDVNGTPLFTRTRNVAQAIRDLDDAVRARDPMNVVSRNFLDASWSRQNAWLDANGKPMDSELSVAQSTGYSANPGEGPSRSFASKAEARARGLKDNPEYDARVALERQLTRSQRFVTLTDLLRDQHTWTKRGGEIDYDAVAAKMVKDGVWKPGDVPMPESGFGKGPIGVSGFRDWIQKVAEGRTQRAAAGSVLPENELKARIDQEFGKVHQGAKESYSGLHPGIAFDADARLDLPGVSGYGLPEDVMTAIMQADPVYARMFLNRQPIRDTFEANVPDKEDLLRDGNHEQLATRMVSGLSALMRLGLLADPAFHPLVNLATQMLTKSGRIDDVFTSFFMPHTIPEADYERMAQYVGKSMRGSTAPATSSERVAEAFYARGPVDRGRNPWKILNPMSLSQRAKIMAAAFKDIPIEHWPQAAITYLDDAQQALVFSVWEDAFKTQLFKRLEKKYGDPYRAALETKKTLTGTGALTAFEKRLGLNRIVWFYAWGKTMTQFWLDQLYRTPRNIVAPMEAVRTQNENVAPGSEAGKKGSYEKAFGIGGPRENKLAFRWGGHVYTTPTIPTPNFVWGGTVADAINVFDPERPLKWVDNFAMNRLSGGYRMLAGALKSVGSGGKQPAPGQIFDPADPDLGHAVSKGFANVAGNFKPMAGPITGPLEAAIGMATGQGAPEAFGATRNIPQQLRTQAFYADQSLRGAITSGSLPRKTRERLYSIVERYEENPSDPQAIGQLVTVAQALHDLEKE